MIPVTQLIVSLRTALQKEGWKIQECERLPVKGISHEHIRLIGTGLIARIPWESPLGLLPNQTLDYEVTCFQRSEPSGHTPRLHGILSPSQELRFGALLVDDIIGSPPDLPAALTPIAQALAALHCLNVPSHEARAPLMTPANPQTDPLGELISLIDRRLLTISSKVIPRNSLKIMSDVVTETRAHYQRCPSFLIRLIGTDTHPGNFLIDNKGKAWFIDLEKVMYGLPVIDLAHATLYTSTMWDRDINKALSHEEITLFYRVWLQNVPEQWREESKVWFDVARRLTWVRTLSWMASWSRSSMRRLPLPLQVHIKKRLAHFFASHTIESIRDSLYIPVDP